MDRKPVEKKEYDTGGQRDRQRREGSMERQKKRRPKWELSGQKKIQEDR